MSSAGLPPVTPRPSVFLSYASEDRAAARALRDTLLGAGLDVWYDENELGGGDAWDQKIRRQIRDCDYFLPMISAATESRKEGYFRREWRLAVERTMDMADDVLFLLPVAIDGTTEIGARVPDKFLTVQWLRLPGGQTTPALTALVQRLLSGDHHAPPRPPLIGRAPRPAAASTPEHDGPPPMPPFPHAPEGGGHRLKFFAEVCWWALAAAWLLFKRLPRWIRVLVSIWLVFSLFTLRCSRTESPKPDKAKSAQVQKAIENAAEKVARKAGSASAGDYAQFARDIAQQFGAKLDENRAEKPFALVPFDRGLDDPAAAKFAGAVFTATYGQFLVAHPNSAALLPVGSVTDSDAALAALAKNDGARFVLSARLAPGDGPRAMAVQLLRVEDATPAWQETFPFTGAEPTAAAARIVEAMASLLGPPKKP